MAQNLLNLLRCYTQFGNTGTSDCDIEPGFITGIILMPRNKVFAREDTASELSWAAAIQDALLADNTKDRIYYFGPFVEATPTGEQPVVQNYGYGSKRQVRRGTIAYDFLMTGGKELHKQQLSFSGNKRSAMLQDSNGVTWGERAYDIDGQKVPTGYRQSNFYVGDYQMPTGQTGGQWMVSIEFSNSSALQENFAYVASNIDPFAGGTGFLSVEHTATSSGPTNVTVTATTSYGADLINTYGDELAQTGGAGVFAFLVKNADEGSPNFGNEVTIASVTKSGAAWILTLAATGVDPDNPGTGKNVSVELNIPSVLKGFTNPVIGLTTPNPVIVKLG